MSQCHSSTPLSLVPYPTPPSHKKKGSTKKEETRRKATIVNFMLRVLSKRLVWHLELHFSQRNWSQVSAVWKEKRRAEDAKNMEGRSKVDSRESLLTLFDGNQRENPAQNMHCVYRSRCKQTPTTPITQSETACTDFSSKPMVTIKIDFLPLLLASVVQRYRYCCDHHR